MMMLAYQGQPQGIAPTMVLPVTVLGIIACVFSSSILHGFLFYRSHVPAWDDQYIVGAIPCGCPIRDNPNCRCPICGWSISAGDNHDDVSLSGATTRDCPYEMSAWLVAR